MLTCFDTCKILTAYAFYVININGFTTLPMAGLPRVISILAQVVWDVKWVAKAAVC